MSLNKGLVVKNKLHFDVIINITPNKNNNTLVSLSIPFFLFKGLNKYINNTAIETININSILDFQ